jgi:hypothetical protein
MGVVEDAAEGIGQGLGAIIGGLMAAIPPMIEAIFPALIDGMKAGFTALVDAVDENKVGFASWVTFFLMMYFAFILIRTKLGGKVGPSLPLVGQVV